MASAAADPVLDAETPLPPGGYDFSPSPYAQNEGPLEAAGRRLQDLSLAGTGAASLPDDPLRSTSVPELSRDVPQPTAATMLHAQESASPTANAADDAGLAAAFLAGADANTSEAARDLDRPPHAAPLPETGAEIGEPASNVAAPAEDLPAAATAPLTASHEITPPPVLADDASHRAIVGEPAASVPDDTSALIGSPEKSPVDQSGRTHAQRLVDEVERRESGAPQSSSLPPPVHNRYYALNAGGAPVANDITTHDADVANYETPASATGTGLHVAGNPAAVDDPVGAVPTDHDTEALAGGALAVAGIAGAGVMAANEIGSGQPEIAAGAAPSAPSQSSTLPPTSHAGIAPVRDGPVAPTAPAAAPLVAAAAPRDGTADPTETHRTGVSPIPATEQRVDPQRLSHPIPPLTGSAPQSPSTSPKPAATPKFSGPTAAAHQAGSPPVAAPDGSDHHPRKQHPHRHPAAGTLPDGAAPATPPKERADKPKAPGPATAAHQTQYERRRSSSGNVFSKIFHRRSASGASDKNAS